MRNCSLFWDGEGERERGRKRGDTGENIIGMRLVWKQWNTSGYKLIDANQHTNEMDERASEGASGTTTKAMQNKVIKTSNDSVSRDFHQICFVAFFFLFVVCKISQIDRA